jgi:hypothetical protein
VIIGGTVIKIEDAEVGEWYYEHKGDYMFYSLVIQKDIVGVDCVEFISDRIICIGHQFFTTGSWDLFKPVYKKIVSTKLARKIYPNCKEKDRLLYVIEKKDSKIIEAILKQHSEKIDEIRKRVQNQRKRV